MTEVDDCFTFWSSEPPSLTTVSRFGAKGTSAEHDFGAVPNRWRVLPSDAREVDGRWTGGAREVDGRCTGGGREPADFDRQYATILGTGENQLPTDRQKPLILATVSGIEAIRTAQCEVRW